MAGYPLDELNLPPRVRNALVRGGITTPDQLAQCDDATLLNLRGIGEGALEQIRAVIRGPGAVLARVPAAPPPGLADVPPTGEGVAVPLLPGRQVLHAAWQPVPRAGLFVWGEGAVRGAANEDAPAPVDGCPMHPFHLAPAALRDALPGLWLAAEREEWRTVQLPTAGAVPQASPQLLHDAVAGDASPGELALRPWCVRGLVLSPLEALTFLNRLPRAEELAPRVALGADLCVWSLLAKLALELLVRQQYAPAMARRDETLVAVWLPILDRTADVRRVDRLAHALPPVGWALTEPDRPDGRLPPRALCRDFLGALVDAAVHAWAPPLLQVVTVRDRRAVQVWLHALFRRDPALPGAGADLGSLETEVSGWLEHLLAGAEQPFRVCLRLEPPPASPADQDDDAGSATSEWVLRFFLQARDDPSLLIPASLVWREQGVALTYLDRRFERPHEVLLAGLGQAARLFPPLADSLRSPSPEVCRLNTEQAYAFLREAAPLLEESGFGVLVPQWWRRRRKSLAVHATVMPSARGGGLGLETLVRFRWRLALGDIPLTPEEFRRLAALKLPLVRVRGEWVELLPEQAEAVIRFLEQRPTGEEEVTLRQALQTGLSQEGEVAGLPVEKVEAQGWVDELLRRLQGAQPLTELPPPQGLHGQLRPYQERGFSWLAFLREWGLGGCLADDMGLGKTIQTIALMLYDLAARPEGPPALVICPTSVVGNWARELARFAPSLRVLVHHGNARTSGEAFLAEAAQADVVISTYALARRDEETLGSLEWRGIVLDEAQNIKNPGAKQTQAIRRLRGGYRFALTGTPVENRLADLWSIMHFLNPGYLGSQKAFHSQFALPIERYQDAAAAARLRRLVQPFILRRVKSDPAIIQDLPDKLENKVYCTLTPEQATLYQAVVDDAIRRVEEAEGMERRGLVLAMLMRLKQVCNHPAHFLGDGSALSDRSGKLDRLGEMLEEVLAVGERALIFTQFAEMGALLQAYLRELFGGEVLFLYGGTPARQRDAMIARFQDERHGPALFVLSLKAGGLGLNLTRANHVFHFDRWWNPAVENQATDRVFRIGQARNVWVHKFVCLGTFEERIDALIESKRDLAERVIGTGEGWLTELSTDELRALVALSREAVED